MGNLVVSDNAATTLAAPISNSPAVSSLVLATGTKFPTINNGGTGSDWSYVTLFDALGNIETVKVTRHDAGSNNMTILRGTAAGIAGVTDATCLAWASGTTGVACRLIAQTVNDMGAAASAAAGSASSAAASAAASASVATNLLPAGTRLLFAQAAAPSGWTQAVTDTEDNRMLRVVKTAGGGKGGTHSPILNNVVPSHTHSFTTGAESATHTHGVSDPGHSHYTLGQYGGGGSGVPGGGNGTGSYAYYTSSSGTGISLGSQSANHTHSGATDNGSSQTNWQPRYLDLILCTKD